MAAPELTQHRFPSWTHALLIGGIGFVLVAGCLGAGFLTYDDNIHIKSLQMEAGDVSGMFTPAANSTYFPVTQLSYSIDQSLFQSWMPRLFGSWAPGVRLMTVLYHSAAALILWRVLLLLRLSPLQSLFVAAAFAVHPLACETVCWVSERKNALAALFGFAALWAWLRWAPPPGEKKSAPSGLGRLAAVAGFYILALLSKPSALGLFPVLLLLDLFDAPFGLEPGAQTRWRPSKKWLTLAARMAPLAVISAIVALVNIAGHERTLVPPPGGSIFTAALTDLEILARYVYNLVFPLELSAAYYVQPVVSLADWRVAAFGSFLVALIWITVRLAARPRLALLGWLWFLGALGPSLNFIAITHLMQDRYIYLSTPGFFIVIAEVAAGLATRFPSARHTVRLAAPAYIALLAAFGLARGTVWNNIFEIFTDAVQRQPQSSFAQNGLGIAYAQAWHTLTKTKAGDPQKKAPEFHDKWIEHWRLSLHCPDADRNLFYSMTANRVAEEYLAQGREKEAEQYWTMGANPPAERPDEPDARAKCLAQLAALRLAKGKVAEAFTLANEAIAARPRDTSLLARANASVALAKEKRAAGDETYALRLIDSARHDLEAISHSSKLYADAQKALANPVFALSAPK